MNEYPWRHCSDILNIPFTVRSYVCTNRCRIFSTHTIEMRRMRYAYARHNIRVTSSKIEHEWIHRIQLSAHAHTHERTADAPNDDTKKVCTKNRTDVYVWSESPSATRHPVLFNRWIVQRICCYVIAVVCTWQERNRKRRCIINIKRWRHPPSKCSQSHPVYRITAKRKQFAFVVFFVSINVLDHLSALFINDWNGFCVQ